ncbi:molybdopterin-guanine dinucleotide biosynthesis protein A [Cyanobium sp. PCC 7001]|nr:molybdopterin-guanine dinucleotide biosynthesis protein A [Cyanobium sp. PCC 7001]
MGVDKALLPHPAGGTWLSHSLRQLATLQAPITLCSHHPLHRQQVEGLLPPIAKGLTLTQESPPGQGPLSALHHLMDLHPGEQLLLCAVDMPWLDAASLTTLVAAGHQTPGLLLVACNGQRLQPLPGIYPATLQHRRSLARFLAGGRRSLLDWLALQPFQKVTLNPQALRNCNRLGDWTPVQGQPVQGQGAFASLQERTPG